MSRYQALDSWRGVAAILVVVYHGALAGPLSVQGVGRGGYLWVDFFFVLSGFVITHAYSERIASGRDAAGFLLRRFGRVWPLHATMLLIYLAAEGLAFMARFHTGDATAFASVNDNTSTTFLANLLLLNAVGLSKGLSWNGPSWSVGAEFWSYVVFCCVVLASRGAARLATFAAISASAGLLLLLRSPHGAAMDTTYDFGFLRALYGFFIGALVHAAVLFRKSQIPTWRSATALEAGATGAAILFLIFCSENRFSLAAPLVFAPLVFVFASQAGALSGVLQRRIFVRLGMWSYSIYMIQQLVLNVWIQAVTAAMARFHFSPLRSVESVGQPLLASNSTFEFLVLQGGQVALLVAIVAIASFTFASIERPARTVFNSLANQLAVRPNLTALKTS